MKNCLKYTLLLISIVFADEVCFAQKIKANSVVKANSILFNTKSSGKKGIAIINSKNIYYNRIPKKSQTAISTFEKNDKSALLKVFMKVFTDQRIKELLPENNLFINYYVDPAGNVLEVSFLLNDNTIVTAKELAQMESEIKATITFKLRPEETKGGDFFVISQAPKYRKVLDRTLE